MPEEVQVLSKKKIKKIKELVRKWSWPPSMHWRNRKLVGDTRSLRIRFIGTVAAYAVVVQLRTMHIALQYDTVDHQIFTHRIMIHYKPKSMA
jgi:hypothetical protein